jgi:hypothetical protein
MFAKLFSSITESSLWSESKDSRLLFVTLLAKADETGFVEASIPGLARVANLTMEETVEALKCLHSPDEYSKNPDNEGRRVLTVPGGFMVLNYNDYRSRRNTEERREYMREYMRNYRKQNVNNGKQSLTDGNRSEPGLAYTDTDTDTDTEKKKKDASAKRFIPPSVDDVKAYCEERGNKVDASSFIDHYAANGWMRGKSKIKDWKACVRTWETPKPNGTTATASIWPAIVAHLGRIDPYKDYSEGIAAKFGNKALAAVKSIGVPNINQANEYQASVLAKRFGELMQ